MRSESIAAAAGVVPARDPAGSINTEAAQENIAKLAYALWEHRGCPLGSSEDDWAEAEKQLLHSPEARSAAAGR